ncbi:MAG: 50S ribosomal protein L6 [Candidatus Magasanikbacteria bacterium]|nr:50S ribosomal protein L6 [Candidatus Magasanikbacteria bacterium]
MSRIGKQLIEIPQGVTVTLIDNMLTVHGPKGILKRAIHPHVSVQIVDNTITVNVSNTEDKATRSLWGTFAAHIKNMVTGVVTEFKKELEINGVGYKVAMHGTDLKLDVGFSHPVIFQIPTGITASTEKNVITLTSADKELLGSIASQIRAIRKPEPYKGKGIKYIDEVIRRKAGKTSAK